MDKPRAVDPSMIYICIDDSRVTVYSRVGNIRRGLAAEARNLHSGRLAGYRLNKSRKYVCSSHALETRNRNPNDDQPLSYTKAITVSILYLCS
jgi:hypothetical protein